MRSLMFLRAARVLKGDQYQTFCAKECGTESADIVMVRLDRAPALAPLFSDWQPVRPTSDGTEEPLAEHNRSR